MGWHGGGAGEHREPTCIKRRMERQGSRKDGTLEEDKRCVFWQAVRVLLCRVEPIDVAMRVGVPVSTPRLMVYLGSACESSHGPFNAWKPPSGPLAPMLRPMFPPTFGALANLLKSTVGWSALDGHLANSRAGEERNKGSRGDLHGNAIWRDVWAPGRTTALVGQARCGFDACLHVSRDDDWMLCVLGWYSGHP